MNTTSTETVYAGKQCEGCRNCDNTFSTRECIHKKVVIDFHGYQLRMPLECANPTNDCPHFEEIKNDTTREEGGGAVLGIFSRHRSDFAKMDE